VPGGGAPVASKNRELHAAVPSRRRGGDGTSLADWLGVAAALLTIWSALAVSGTVAGFPNAPASGSGSPGAPSREAVTAPPGLSCPTAEAVRGELRRLGVTPGAAVSLIAAPGALRVELRDEAGELLLARGFTVEPRDCAAAAGVVAIVVERQRRGLMPPDPPRAIVGQTRQEALPRLQLSLGPALLGTTLGASLEARAAIGGPLAVAAALTTPAETGQAIGAGYARLRAIPLAGRVLASTRGRLSLSISLDGVLALEGASSEGIAVPSTRRRLALSAGPGVGASVALGRRFRLGIDAGIQRALLAAPFLVEGAGEVLRPPAWRGLLALRIGWVVLR
jgi:hypothetical protein